MKQLPDLEQLELRAYRSLWEDGLLDLMVGIGVLGIGLAWLADGVVFGAALPPILVPIWVALRRRLVEPRAGYVELGRDRQKRQRRGLSALLAVGVGFLVLTVGAWWVARVGQGGPLWVQLVPALPASLLALGMALVGLLFGIGRFGLYAVLFVLSGTLGTAAGLDPGWHFLPPAAVILAVGAVLLTGFLRAYPPLEAEGGG